MQKTFFRRFVRPLIPFPKQKTLKRIFPRFETRNVVHLAHKYGIDLMIDVGANYGQFVEKMRSARFRGDIISFEPISAAHAFLVAKAGRDPHWHIAPRMAIGDTEGDIEINIYADSSLSSPYRIIDSNETPVIERVHMMRLDDALTGFDLTGRQILLKIDVQGFETAVLDGAPETLEKATAIMLEVSLLPMYEHETPYLEMLSRLRELGFHAVYFAPVLNRNRLGEAVQMDAFLVRNPGAR